MTRSRIDAVLVERGLFPSREQARAAILAGEVRVDGRGRDQGRPARRRGRRRSRSPRGRGSSRAAETSSPGRSTPSRSTSPVCASSTSAPPPAGSPTACCSAERRQSVAVDVGYGQLAWSLRTDPRVDGRRAHEHPRRDPAELGRPVRPGGHRRLVHLPAQGAAAPRLAARCRRRAARGAGKAAVRSG